MWRTRSWTWAVLAIAVGGCGSMLQMDWLPDGKQLNRWPYGSAAYVAPRAWGAPHLKGELIAIGRDTVHVLNPRGLTWMLRDEVRRIEVRADYVGNLSDHFDIRKSMKPEEIEKGWDRMRQFARYPGGLPDSLDRAALRLPPTRSARRQRSGTFLNP